jgi:hypothetical protein
MLDLTMLPEGTPWWGYPLVLCLSLAVPLTGAFAYLMKRRAEARLMQMQAEIEQEKARARADLQAVKADTAAAMASSRSIEALSATLTRMVEERTESTAATRENTSALRDVSVRLDDWDKRQADFFRTFGTNMATFNIEVTRTIQEMKDAFNDTMEKLSRHMDSIGPAVGQQVSPLIKRVEMLISEVQTMQRDNRAHDMNLRDSIGDIRVLSQDMQQVLKHLNQFIEMFEKGEHHETVAATVSHPVPAAAGEPAGAGAVPGDGGRSRVDAG